MVSLSGDGEELQRSAALQGHEFLYMVFQFLIFTDHPLMSGDQVPAFNPIYLLYTINYCLLL